MKSVVTLLIVVGICCTLAGCGACGDEVALQLRNPLSLPRLAPQNAMPRGNVAVFAAPVAGSVAPAAGYYGAAEACPVPYNPAPQPPPLFGTREK